jgi:cobalt-zinc-cadmium efflux system outer membrane protein
MRMVLGKSRTGDLVRWRSGHLTDKQGMSIRHLFLVSGLIAAGWLTAPLAAGAQTAPADTALDLPAVLQAASHNPDVQAARRALEAARADVRAADRAPAPVLSAGVSSIDLANGTGSGSFWTQRRLDKSLGLDWTWERGNKRGLRTEVAERAAQAAQADSQDMLVLQQIGALGAFYDLLAAQERLQTLQALADSATALARTADLRLKAGDLSPQDTARTRIEAERAQAELQSATLAHRQAMQALSVWTGQSVPSGGWRARAAWPEPSTATATDVEALVEQRPDVRAARERLAAADAALQGAQALNRADPTLGASFDHYPDGSKTNRLLALRISVPINGFSRFDGEIGRALAQKDLAQDLLDKTRLQARAELLSLQQAWQSQSSRLQGYEQRILPQAQQVAAQAELAYSKGGLGLTELLDARRTLRATQLEATGVRSDHARALGAWQLRSAHPTKP